MPTKKYEWTAWDRCAAEEMAAMMRDEGYSDRVMEAKLDSAISYNRVRDIRKGLKAPLRLSEFLLICEVCHADPVATLQRIIDEARRIQAQEAAAAREPEPVDPVAATLAKVQRGDYDVVALRSSHKYDGDGDEAA